jgi:hypothetical protein
VRHTAWRHPNTDALVYLETEYHPDAREDSFFVAWIEADGDWPIQQKFDAYDVAEEYARDLVLTYTEGVL